MPVVKALSVVPTSKLPPLVMRAASAGAEPDTWKASVDPAVPAPFTRKVPSEEMRARSPRAPFNAVLKAITPSSVPAPDDVTVMSMAAKLPMAFWLRILEPPSEELYRASPVK